MLTYQNQYSIISNRENLTFYTPTNDNKSLKMSLENIRL